MILWVRRGVVAVLTCYLIDSILVIVKTPALRLERLVLQLKRQKPGLGRQEADESEPTG